MIEFTIYANFNVVGTVNVFSLFNFSKPSGTVQIRIFLADTDPGCPF